MNIETVLPGRLHDLFQANDRGVIGLVEGLVGLCEEQGLRLSWQNNACRVESIDGQKLAAIPLQKSVFRAILARVASLCDQDAAGPVSPYGGDYLLSRGSKGSTHLRVAFANQPNDLRLEIMPVVAVKNGKA